MIFPTTQAAKRVGHFKDLVIASELDSRMMPDPDDSRIAAIHTRQDIVLLVGWERELHSQLVTISRGVWLIAAVIVYIVVTRFL
jgi:hypothetical protein